MRCINCLVIGILSATFSSASAAEVRVLDAIIDFGDEFVPLQQRDGGIIVLNDNEPHAAVSLIAGQQDGNAGSPAVIVNVSVMDVGLAIDTFWADYRDELAEGDEEAQVIERIWNRGVLAGRSAQMAVPNQDDAADAGVQVIYMLSPRWTDRFFSLEVYYRSRATFDLHGPGIDLALTQAHRGPREGEHKGGRNAVDAAPADEGP